MTKYIKTAVTLFLISAVCTLLCAIVNNATAPVIAANNENDRIAALEAVSSGFAIGEQQEGDGDAVNYAIALTDGTGAVAGYILGLTGKGYGGAMDIIASYSLDGSIMAAKLTTNSESPGIGKKAENDWYMDMFKGLGADDPIPVSKNDLPSEQSALISGASITFSGITAALRSGSEFVKGLGGAV